MKGRCGPSPRGRWQSGGAEQGVGSGTASIRQRHVNQSLLCSRLVTRRTGARLTKSKDFRCKLSRRKHGSASADEGSERKGIEERDAAGKCSQNEQVSGREVPGRPLDARPLRLRRLRLRHLPDHPVHPLWLLRTWKLTDDVHG